MSWNIWKYYLKLVGIRILQLLCTTLIRLCLRTPAHMAIIMDGNRRFARRVDMGLHVGYRKGHDKLMSVMKCCTLLGVREVTVYAFSIENFKRSADEVHSIMQLAREKFQEMLDKLGDMNAWGVQVRIIGRQDLLSPGLRTLGARATLATRHNTRLRLNIAFPYTGRDEISRAASFIVDGVRNQELTAEDVDEELVSRVLELGEPELLVRTSGEVRLSDYMLWQVSRTVLYFTETLWPDFNLVELLRALHHYTRLAPAPTPRPRNDSEKRKQFLENVQKARWQQIEKFAA